VTDSHQCSIILANCTQPSADIATDLILSYSSWSSAHQFRDHIDQYQSIKKYISHTIAKYFLFLVQNAAVRLITGTRRSVHSHLTCASPAASSSRLFIGSVRPRPMLHVPGWRLPTRHRRHGPSRTPLRDLYAGYGAVITSGQPYYVSAGYPYTTASTVQDRCPGLEVSKRSGTVVLGRWLSTRLRRPSASTPFVWLWRAPSDVHGSPTATGVLPLLAHECGTLCQPN